MENYDPNITWNDSVVRITLQQWGYKGTFDIPTGGNVRGMDLIRTATDEDVIYDALEENLILNNQCQLKLMGEDDEGADWFSCVLTAALGDTCDCEQEFSDLAGMIVAAELISFEKKASDDGGEGDSGECDPEEDDF